MRLPIYHVDAFTGSLFSGNPAAVCPLQTWLPDETMLAIARENALAETAFFIPQGSGYALRWFTPEIEMDLCGHATLASAHVIARHLHPGLSRVDFSSRSGPLSVVVGDRLLTLDFPSRKAQPCQAPKIILDAFPSGALEVLKARDYMLVYASEETIRTMQPDQVLLNQINTSPGGIIVTAKGSDADFISRFFTPQASVFEDPVTGSAHCTLIPYWSEKLGKKIMEARQLSARGGRLHCQDLGERVLISGEAITYSEGFLTL